jgi:hypothetical protein
MIITPRRLDLSKQVKKKEEPAIKKALKIEPIKVETIKKAPRKLIEEEEEKFDFSLEDEEK